MKRSRVDYSGFRKSRINQKQHAHLRLLWGWAVYFVLFFLTERLISAESCFSVRCAADDTIPFCKALAIPCVLWCFPMAQRKPACRAVDVFQKNEHTKRAAVMRPFVLQLSSGG